MASPHQADRSRSIGPVSATEGVVVVPCADLDEAIAGYEAVGFQLQALGPADDPQWAELAMPGVSLRLEAGAGRRAAPYIRVQQRPSTAAGIDKGGGLTADVGATLPGGSAPPDAVEAMPVELVEAEAVLTVPRAEPALAVEHERAGGWNTGRAGMRYRDLIPERHGGAYIASHIHVPAGGPVPDYVHHHDIAYQLIFCHRGWVRVVYQDQGPPFVMEPGDCVLQPPGIRHRVLESSDDLYVVEISCPASHRTNLDHGLSLPTSTLEPNRRYGGQRFVRHVAAEAPWHTDPASPFESQDTGIGEATGGLASARVLRAAIEPQGAWSLDHRHDLYILFVLSGGGRLVGARGQTTELDEGSSVAVPAPGFYSLQDVAAGTRILEVASTVPPT